MAEPYRGLRRIAILPTKPHWKGTFSRIILPMGEVRSILTQDGISLLLAALLIIIKRPQQQAER